EREKKDLNLKVSGLNKNLLEFDSEQNNLDTKKENINKRIVDLTAEKNNLILKIENSEKDYERNTEDVTGILQILNMLTQNINISVESIKSNIQQSNAEAIESSADNFKKFVLDIVDIMKSIESVSESEEEKSETTIMLNSILQTLTLFTENVDITLDQLINRVKESADVEIQQSTSTFDSFVQDLMEILENVYLSLRKLTMSKSQELYKQLEEISESINSQNEDLNEVDMKLSETKIQKKNDSENLLVFNQRLEGVNKRILEINQLFKTSEDEIQKRNTSINQLEKEDFRVEINNLKNLRNEYWEKISSIQSEIDNKQKDFENLQNKLQDLKGIQNLFEDILDIEHNVKELNASIESKKGIISKTEEDINNLNLEQVDLDNRINSLITEKENYWENVEVIRKEIEKYNKRLEEKLDQLRALENIMMIINNIEELTKENIEADKNIELCLKDIKEFNSQVKDIEDRVGEIQKQVDDLRNEKNKELQIQKKAQNELNRFNKDLQKTQKKLNELNKNKEREQKIVSLNEDIKTTETQINTILENIEKLKGNLNTENEKKRQKQEEIDSFIKQKDESWKKQKSYQKILNDLKSDFSMENSKLNNYESKKIMTSDQIETLYQRSKDYGPLPQVTSDLSESGLQTDIVEATKKQKALEPVNLKAIEQYDNVKERFDEIDMRRQTIQRERKSILDAIEKIELEKTRTFMKAYHEINREFSRIFQKLSPGGSAKMILDRPDKPFEGGISIEARPRGKKISNLEILSGGEKTLVALSFIFSIQEFMPSPFYVLDEIDAQLDGPNVHRVSMLLKEISNQAQFLVISHREENIVNADRIYGVSMQQSGITDVFSVDLEEEAKRLLDISEVPTNIEEN
ncbi:MAG: hypothetical protein ACFFGP_02910, partial [Promethearchaeota archaeon]